MSPLSPSPILVTGLHRSGTTWVGRTLPAGTQLAYVCVPMSPPIVGAFCLYLLSAGLQQIPLGMAAATFCRFVSCSRTTTLPSSARFGPCATPAGSSAMPLLSAGTASVGLARERNGAADHESRAGDDDSIRRQNEYYDIVRHIALERGLLLIDTYTQWVTLRACDRALYAAYVPDGCHPSAAGCARITTPCVLVAIGVP